MGKVSWKTRKELMDERRKAPVYEFQRQETRNDYFHAPTASDDFDKFLMTDNENNYWFKRPEDWYRDKDKPDHPEAGVNWEELTDEEKSEYTEWIRAQQVPIAWKSAIGNADMKTNFFTSKRYTIYRGDIMQREDGKIFMLDWNVQYDPNALNSQTIECNTYFEFKRHMLATADERGRRILPERDEIVVPKIPGVCSEYTGRPDFEVLQGTVGITSGNLLTCYVQWNPTTQQLRINDTFEFGNYIYRVENISIERVEITRQHGEILFHARRVTGGDIV